MTDKTLRLTLRFIRRIKGLEIKEIAKEQGIYPSYLSQIETGKRSLSTERLEKLLAYHGMTHGDFFKLADLLEKYGEHGILDYFLGVTI